MYGSKRNWALFSITAGPGTDVCIVISDEDLGPCTFFEPELEFDGGVRTDTFDMVVVATGAYRVPQVCVCVDGRSHLVSVTCRPCIGNCRGLILLQCATFWIVLPTLCLCPFF